MVLSKQQSVTTTCLAETEHFSTAADAAAVAAVAGACASVAATYSAEPCCFVYSTAQTDSDSAMAEVRAERAVEVELLSVASYSSPSYSLACPSSGQHMRREGGRGLTCRI